MTRKHLTSAQKFEIVHCDLKPTELLKKYGCHPQTLKAIKSGSGAYADFGGSLANWGIYFADNYRSFLKEMKLANDNRKRYPGSLEERYLNVITSPDHPAILMEETGYTMNTIRLLKSGQGSYAGYGGSPEIWADYVAQYGNAIKIRLKQ
jgi:hypothetical protein